MSAIAYLHKTVVPAALSLLPEKMAGESAEAMMLAIVLQESRGEFRRQVKGPARGFTQFEIGGVRGVVTHPQSRPLIIPILERMAYPVDLTTVQLALADNDILAMVFTRLLLWTHPAPLPLQGEEDKSWQYYVNLWRPGKPHRETWDAFYQGAWSTVKGG